MTGRKAGVGALALVALLGVAIIAMLLSRTSSEPLDPNNPTTGGSQALASVLGDQGVRVRSVDNLQDASTGAGRNVTVLVAAPPMMSDARLRQLAAAHRDSARLILIAPDPQQVTDVFGVPTTGGESSTSLSSQQGNCHLAWARGLTMSVGAAVYSVERAGVGQCFTGPHGSGAVELAASPEHPPVLIIGSVDAFTNNTMKQGDNAAIGLRALGQTSELVWYSGGFDPESAAANQPSILPKWLMPAVWLLAVSVVMLMLWRGRRLGRLVQEPLPVIVPANETTMARGRLYRKAQDTARTASVLRSATRQRLRRSLGLGRNASAAEIAERAATQTGRDPHDVGALLTDDHQPISEAELARLARELTALERQVRPS
ncbi:DUF4350 domain-containing protein [Yimella sp. cx-573]|nr:DUF4350 domain-containing protein [Yimella sp. cx-573]